MSQKTKSIALLAIPILIAVAVSLVLQTTILTNPERVTNWLSAFGPAVILVYILLQSLTIIIAPIGGFFLQVAMMALFPPSVALFIIYLVSTPLYLVNFYLARRFGRPLVQKIVGPDALKEIDKLAKDAGVITVIVLKVLQGGIFDYLSYALGLTQISFKTFALINFLGGIPGIFLSYYIFTRFDSLTSGIIAIMVTAYVLSFLAILANYQLKKLK